MRYGRAERDAGPIQPQNGSRTFAPGPFAAQQVRRHGDESLCRELIRHRFDLMKTYTEE